MYGDPKKDSRPFFRTNATLAIPNIVMQPALDEVQQGLNKAVQSIISSSKGVAQWSKERKRTVKVNTKLYHLHRGQGEHKTSSPTVGVCCKERKRAAKVNTKLYHLHRDQGAR